VFLIVSATTEAVASSIKLNKVSLIGDPNCALKNFSPGSVKTQFLIDVFIASSFLTTVKSLVTGCGVNEKLISLNDFEVILLEIGMFWRL
jgi:hypothetical protein